MTTGHILQINVKDIKAGKPGLPKYPIDRAYLSSAGVEGDFNHYRTSDLQGDPDQALLIMTIDAIERLNQEGWPIEPGHIGENVTVDGIAYDDFTPGRQVRVGDAIVEITKACTPCVNLYKLPYIGEERGPEFLRAMNNRRGWYARVVEQGDIAPGATVKLLDE